MALPTTTLPRTLFATAYEDGGGAAFDRAALLGNVSGLDPAAALDIQIDDLSLPAGVVYNHVPGFTTVSTVSYYGFTQVITVPTVDTLTIDPSNAAYQSLAAGQEQDVVVTYSVSDGTNVITAEAVFQVFGTNDAPVVAAPMVASATEGGAAVTVNGTANATDIDNGTVLTVVAAPPPPGEIENVLNAAGVAEAVAPPPPPVLPFDPATLPAGVTFDAATSSFSIDPTDPAYASLTAGQTVSVTVNYGVSDGTVATATSVTFTVIGTNGVPVVSGAATVVAHEDGGGASFDRAALLSHVTDPNLAGTLTIQIDDLSLPAGVVYHHVTGSTTISTTSYYGVHQIVTIPTVDTLTIDTSDAAYQSLAEGESMDVVVTYGVGNGTSTAQAQAIFQMIGSNDAPVVAGPVAAAAVEGGSVVTISGIANATDIDHGAVLSVAAAPPPSGEAEALLNAAGVAETAPPPPPPILAFDPATLPAGVTFDAATNSFSIDPTNAAYASLVAGQTATVSFSYGVSDGFAATAATATFTVTGTNNAPVVSGPVTGLFVNEDGASGSYDLPALLSTAHDPDLTDRLTVTIDASNLPAGVSFVSTPEHVVPGYTIAAYVIPAGPRGTSWGAYVYPATYVPAQVIPDQIVAATTVLTIDPSDPAYQALAEGDSVNVVVNYMVTDGEFSVPAQAIFVVNGMNDAPVVSGPISAGATEDGAAVSVNALANATDVDHGSVLWVAAAPVSPVVISGPGDSAADIAEATALAAAAPIPPMPFDASTLPPGVTFDAVTNSFSVDATNAAYQHLSAGQTQQITINYGVTDGLTVTASSIVLTVTGTNDVPIVSAPQHFAVQANTAAFVINPMANVTDTDTGDSLQLVAAPRPAGVTSISIPGGYYMPDIIAAAFDPNDPSFRSLAAGEVADVAWTYDVTDGTATVQDSMTFTVTGVNDAPVVSAPVSAAATEDAAIVTVDALANTTDADHNAVLSVVGVPAALPAGVTYNAATHSFSIDPADASFQQLAQGETQQVVIAYGVTDGMVTTAASVIFTVTGTNDAPVISGPMTASPNEGSGIVTVNAAGNASDVDDHQGLRITGMPASLPVGVTYDAATQRLMLDTNNPAFDSLAKGESLDVVVNYNIFDGFVEVPTSTIFSVQGKNDVPVVAGVVQAGTVSEDAAVVAINLLARTSDVDHNAALAVKTTQGATITASVVSGTWTAPIAFNLSGNMLNIDPAQFGGLHTGQNLDILINYTVTDGNTGGDLPASARITIAGANDTPAAISLSTPHVMENSLAGTVIGQLSAVDTDLGETLSFQITNDPSGFFAISGTSLVVAAGAQLDYETTTSYNIDVKVTDSTGLSSTRTLAIAVDNQLGVTINGTSGNDTFNATTGTPRPTEEGDTINGNNGNDVLDGLGGNDVIDGGAGLDTLIGGAGDDTLTGGKDADTVQGGAGNDRIIISGSDGVGDVFNGGTGIDTLAVSGSGSLTLAGFDATAQSIEIIEGNNKGIVGTSANETFDLSGIVQFTLSGIGFLDASTGNNTVTGSAFADDLRAGSGIDSIHGGAGNDIISAGAGADKVWGDAGNDTMTGGADADTFGFAAAFGKDIITDFTAGTGTGHDVLDFSASIFASFAAAKAAAVQTGADTVFTSGVDTLTLKNVIATNLVAADFAFH